MPVTFNENLNRVTLIQTCAEYEFPERAINNELSEVCIKTINIIENNFRGYCWYLNEKAKTEWGYGSTGLGDQNFRVDLERGRECVWVYPHGRENNFRIWFAAEKLSLIENDPNFNINDYSYGSYLGLEINYYKPNGGWYYIQYTSEDNYEELLSGVFSAVLG